MNYRIFPPEDILEATLQLPMSKSIAARAMLIDALCGRSSSAGQHICSDTDHLQRALELRSGTADLGGSGTALRFLTAFFAATEGADITLTGDDSLLRRPVEPLVDALRTLGADIEYTDRPGHAPLHIRGRRLSGGTVTVDSSHSSQYLSALMLTAPVMEAPLTILTPGKRSSEPYMRLTAAMMEKAGVTVDIIPESITVSGTYNPVTFEPEADWSAATYWYETAAISAGWITLPDLRLPSAQPDAATADIFVRLGVLTAQAEDCSGLELSATPDLHSRLDIDVSGTPDMVPALVITACAIGTPFSLTGVESLRHKECDRLEALTQEMQRIGCHLDIEHSSNSSALTLSWDGRRFPVTEMPEFNTYGDHRMAMALAPLALLLPGMIIKDTEVTDKSYPGFWDCLRAAGFTLEEE